MFNILFKRKIQYEIVDDDDMFVIVIDDPLPHIAITID